MDPLFSVIIPAYNSRFSILNTIKSVLGQSMQNFEVIVVDDGSTDDTNEVLRSNFKDDRIKYFYKKNEGVSTARNFGVKNSSGRYLTFLDSDDKVEGNWLSNFSELTQGMNEIVFCAAKFIYPDGSVKIKSPSKLNYLYGFMTGIFNAGTYAIRKDMFRKVGGFDPEIKFGENYDLGVRVAALNPTYAFNNQANLIYHKEVKRDRNSLINRIEAKRLILDKYRKLNHFSEVQYMEFRHQTLQSMAVDLIQLGEKREGRRIFFEALKGRPMSVKVLIRLILTFTNFYGRA